MFLLLLKYYLRSSYFIVSILYLIIIGFEIIIKVNLVIVPTIFLQRQFLKKIDNYEINFYLLRITNCDIGYFIKLNNLILLLFANVFYLLGKVLMYLITEYSIGLLLNDFLILNILLFVSFIIGNISSNSDIVQLKSKFWQNIANSFLFQISIIGSYSICIILTLLEYNCLYLLLVLLLLILIWQKHLKALKTINYFKYIIK